MLSAAIWSGNAWRKILWEWLEIEKSRDLFVVRALETDRLVSIGGLEVKTRADRVDELPSGRDIILDYKTGQLNSKAWESDRPNEPQLPLYCATSERPIAATAFAQIRVGVLRFQGARPRPALRCRTWWTCEWRKRHCKLRSAPLARSAGAVSGKVSHDGRADVDPKDGVREHCGQWGLCRYLENLEKCLTTAPCAHALWTAATSFLVQASRDPGKPSC